MEETNLFYELTFGLFEKLANLCDSMSGFLYKEIHLPLLGSLLDGGGFELISVRVIDMVGPSLVVLLVGWLIIKLAPVI